MKRRIMSVGAAILFGLVSFASDVSASNWYGIVYEDGVELGEDNLTVNPELVNNLEVLVDGSVEGSSFEYIDNWEQGYEKVYDVCRPVRYFKVRNEIELALQSPRSADSDGYAFAISNDRYTEVVTIERVVFDEFDSDKAVAIMVEPDGMIAARRQAYTDENCSNRDSEVGEQGINGGKVFVETNIKIYDNETDEPVSFSELYFALTDIDVAQSYMILNDGNELSKDNMFVSDVNSLQPTGTSLRNKYNEDYKYIYSEYSGAQSFDIKDPNAIYVRVGSEAQDDGLRVVFGYASYAGSGTKFYTKQFRVTYDSDDFGEITGLDGETVIAGGSPTGSTQRPNQKYLFRYWVADQDVTLKSGETIPKGEMITDEQMKEVIVDKDIKFTAIHVTEDESEESEVAVPNTGEFTGGGNGVLMMGLLMPGVVLVILLGSIYNNKRNKVRFEKK